jgi:hypothetical protein
VFSERHLFSFIPFEEIQFWAGTPTRSVQVCKRPGRDHSVSNFEKPGAARRTRMLCGIFSAISLQSSLLLARAGQRGVAGVAAGCWVVDGAPGGAAAGRAAAGAAAGRVSSSQRPFTVRIFRAFTCGPRHAPWRSIRRCHRPVDVPAHILGELE